MLHYGWRDYESRVGGCSILLDALEQPASVIANSAMYECALGLMAAFRARGDEVVGHGRTISDRQSVLDKDEALGQQSKTLQDHCMTTKLQKHRGFGSAWRRQERAVTRLQ